MTESADAVPENGDEAGPPAPAQADRPATANETKAALARRGLARHQGELLLGLFVLTFAVPAIGLIGGPGSTYEEGYLLTQPWQSMIGMVPHRDFFSLYGPSASTVPALIYRVVGVGLTQERVLGIVLLAVLVGALMAISARALPGDRWAKPITLLAFCIPVFAAEAVASTAWWWGLACVAAGAAIGLKTRARTDGQVAYGAAAAGFLLTFALGFRPDLAVASGLVLIATVPPWIRRMRVGALAGIGAGAIPLLIHAGLLGLPKLFHDLFWVPVVQLRPTRHLPMPPSWSHAAGSLQRFLELEKFSWPLPHLGAAGQIAAYFWIEVAIVLVGGIFLWIRRRHVNRAAVVFWCLGAGVMGQLLQRPDFGHLVLVGAVVLPLGAVLVRIASPKSWLAPVAIAVVVLGLLPQLTASRYAEAFVWGANDRAAPVSRDGRRVMAASPAEATALQGAVDALGRELSPGQTLIVGTADLSRTVRNDAGLYYLFPELRPGTYYTEMNPGITDTADSGLADEVTKADWLVLSSVWDAWSEPNESDQHGDPRPNEIVRKQFCEVPTPEESVKLYRRCK